MSQKATTIFNMLKAIFIALSILLFLHFTVVQSKDKIKSIGFYYSLPLNVIQREGQEEIYYLQDSIIISFYEDIILYKLEETRDFETDKKVLGTAKYFIYKKDQKNGFLFNYSRDSLIGMYSVDSLLKKEAMGGEKLELLSSNFWKPTEIIQDVKNNSTIEKYIPIKKPDETCFDSIYLYLTPDYNDIDYTLSSQIDSARKQKLYKTRLLYNQFYSEVQKRIIPKREFKFEIRRLTPNSPTATIAFFEKFKGLNLYKEK